MNVKSIMSLTMAAAAVAFVSIAPAEAKGNNNQALNMMAMQMYAQNQAAAGNPYVAGYNPYVGAAVNPYATTNPYYGYSGGPTPWSAGAIPATGIYGNGIYGNVYGGATPWSAGAIPAAGIYGNRCAPVQHSHRRWWR